LQENTGVPGTPADTLDEYERQLGETLRAWTPEHRLAFVAALAERWLQVYEKFSAAQGHGDPALLRRIVGEIWDHQGGRLMAPDDAVRFSQQINENAPDTEEFDQLSAWRALQACVILGLALKCCQETDNAATVRKAAVAAFEAVIGDYPSGPAAQRRAWRKVAVQEEFARQSALRDAIGPVLHLDDQTIAMVRSDLGPVAQRGRAGGAASPRKKKRVEGDGVDSDRIEEWRAFVRGQLKRSAAHRIAFAAALAERHLPRYQSFMAATGKGQPDLLARVLEAVWQTARGEPVAATALQELQTNLRQVAPDRQEPDGWGAWSAWRLLELSLACCGVANNSDLAEEAAVAAFECVAGPGSSADPLVWKNQYRRPEIHNEITRQIMVLTYLRAKPTLDAQSLEPVRQRS
jgi:uncharacterized protein YjaG (DUF416 family)